MNSFHFYLVVDQEEEYEPEIEEEYEPSPIPQLRLKRNTMKSKLLRDFFE
jgi:hypothetical protein